MDSCVLVLQGSWHVALVIPCLCASEGCAGQLLTETPPCTYRDAATWAKPPSDNLRVINNRYSPIFNFDQQWVRQRKLCWELQTFSDWKWHRGSELVTVALVHFHEGMQTALLGLFHMQHTGSRVIHLQTQGKVNCLFLMSSVMVQVCFVKYEGKFFYSCEKKLLTFTASIENISD